MTFDFTLLVNKMLYLKNLKSDSIQNWNAFWKIIDKDKCLVSKNFKKSFLRYIENATGSVRNFAKCILNSYQEKVAFLSFLIRMTLYQVPSENMFTLKLFCAYE